MGDFHNNIGPTRTFDVVRWISALERAADDLDRDGGC
jgi:hypothetical protein